MSVSQTCRLYLLEFPSLRNSGNWFSYALFAKFENPRSKLYYINTVSFIYLFTFIHYFRRPWITQLENSYLKEKVLSELHSAILRRMHFWMTSKKRKLWILPPSRFFGGYIYNHSSVDPNLYVTKFPDWGLVPFRVDPHNLVDTVKFSFTHC